MKVFIDNGSREVTFHSLLRNYLLDRHYVYILCRPNGVPFYVGVGKGRRIEHHERIAKSGNESHKSRLIRLVTIDGGQIIRTIVSVFEDRNAAEDLERELIKTYGREDKGLGCLVNHTDGGEGTVGCHLSDERKMQISAQSKGRPRPLHVIEAVIKAHTGAKRSQKTRDLMRLAWTPERKAAHSIACKARTVSQSTRDAISSANKGRKVDREVVERRSALLRGRKHSEEQKRKAGAGVSLSWTVERRNRQSDLMKKMRSRDKNADSP